MQYPQLERVGTFCIKCNQIVCICKNLKDFNKKVKTGEYVISPEYRSLFGTIKHYLSETNVMISCNDYNCLSDAQKEKYKPVYK